MLDQSANIKYQMFQLMTGHYLLQRKDLPKASKQKADSHTKKLRAYDKVIH